MLESFISPPAKRQRTDEPGCSQNLAMCRSEKFWFNDGSIILQADTTQFCVHSSMLSRHSTIFADMFSVPQPENESMIEGCPIVHLSDSAKDMEELLAILYDNLRSISHPTLRAYKHKQAWTFSTIAAAVRLGRKYEIDHVRSEALRRLQHEFPSSMDDWEEAYDGFSEIIDEAGTTFDVINLALENDIQSILPAVYLGVCSYPLSKIFSGKQRDDGTVAKLSSLAIQSCVMGRERLIAALPLHSLSFLKEPNLIPCSNCSRPSKCRKVRVETVVSISRDLETIDPKDYLHKWEDQSDSFCENLCSKCSTVAEESYNEGTETLWKSLPTYFGLPEWEDLKDFES